MAGVGPRDARGSLDLGGAPSWKPLPYLFTVPYSLNGRFAMWMWMVDVGRDLAGRGDLRRAHGLPPDRNEEGESRWPAIAAALFAGVALLGIDQYMHDILSVQSDPMIVSLCLAAIDCHLSRRPRWAFWLLVLGALGRPEVWPFVGLYGLWAWWKIPAMRWMVYAGLPGDPAAVVRDPTITNHRPFVIRAAARCCRRASCTATSSPARSTATPTLEYLPSSWPRSPAW